MDRYMKLKSKENFKGKVKYIGESWGISLTKDKVYDCLGVEPPFLRIIDDTEEDYLYPLEKFRRLDGSAISSGELYT